MIDIRSHRLTLALAHLGYDALRATVWPIGVGARVMLVKDNSVLLVYHSYLDNWHFPGGGMKRGETLPDAARREAYEEAGVVITGELRLLGLFAGFTRGRSDHTAVFAAEEFALQKPTDRWEIIGRAFFAFDALPPNLTRGYRKMIARYRQDLPPVIEEW